MEPLKASFSQSRRLNVQASAKNWCNPPLLITPHLKVKCTDNHLRHVSSVDLHTQHVIKHAERQSEDTAQVYLLWQTLRLRPQLLGGNCQCCHPPLQCPLQHDSTSLCFEGFKAGGLLGFDIRESKTILNLEEQMRRSWLRVESASTYTVIFIQPSFKFREIIERKPSFTMMPNAQQPKNKNKEQHNKERTETN